MSIAGGNPSLIIDTLVNTSQLGTGLRQAEAQVAQSTMRMTQQTDRFAQKWGSGIEAAFMRFAGPVFAIQIGDQLARGIADGIRKNQNLFQIMEELNFEIGKTLPILGPLFAAQQRAGTSDILGVSAGEMIFNFLHKAQIPVPEQLGGGNFQLGRGGGFVPAEGQQRQRDLENRIQRLQRAMIEAQPVPTRGEMLSEQLSRQMGGAMGQAQTALGTFKFAQMGADAQAEIARNVTKQVDLMMQIRDATEELRKLTASN